MIKTKILVTDPVPEYGKIKIIITESKLFSVKLIGGTYLLSIPQLNWCYQVEEKISTDKNFWKEQIPVKDAADYIGAALVKYGELVEKEEQEEQLRVKK